ncbi:class I SAM-dependent methyltransferase [Marinicauda algicola]|uniref:Class I SAM-dependent methyltransferase n=1 Tax=Marinicauda algicola TaxID=2029849 RepID=A0A4S2GW17_9PROT|nr:class I SAM-dependent methyltransferase [Marinicauda algicola]TGY87256.1 class I SAM-dependent methyltransferase [Marinicauda algicola]
MNEKGKAWGAKSLGVEGSARIVRHHPSELMLRALFSSRYSGLAPEITGGTRVLDVGAMYLNNLVPFADRGCECHGIEINEDMAAISRQAAKDQGIDAEIRVGSNRSIPHEDARFDILLSINVIHYEDDAKGLRAAMAEYARVLAPGGRCFVVSAGPGHYLRRSATRLGPNRYEIAYEDFRKGQTMAYFESEDQLGEMMREVFCETVTGRMTERHAKADVDFFYALGAR